MELCDVELTEADKETWRKIIRDAVNSICETPPEPNDNDM